MTDYADLEKRLLSRAGRRDCIEREAADALKSLQQERDRAVQLARDVLDETYAGHYLSDETTKALSAWIERATGR